MRSALIFWSSSRSPRVGGVVRKNPEAGFWGAGRNRFGIDEFLQRVATGLHAIGNLCLGCFRAGCSREEALPAGGVAADHLEAASAVGCDGSSSPQSCCICLVGSLSKHKGGIAEGSDDDLPDHEDVAGSITDNLSCDRAENSGLFMGVTVGSEDNEVCVVFSRFVQKHRDGIAEHAAMMPFGLEERIADRIENGIVLADEGTQRVSFRESRGGDQVTDFSSGNNAVTPERSDAPPRDPHGFPGGFFGAA